jgi:uncharacterized membrane protein
MRNILIQDDVKLVEDRLKQFEAHTGCDLLLVITDYSDPYPAASLRFGLIGAFVVSLAFSYYLEFQDSWMWPILFLLLSGFLTWLGHFNWAKRLALSDWETDRECKEKAIEYFHTLGTSKVSHKVTAMIMLSTLEKNIQVLVDEQLKTKIDHHELEELIKLMSAHFREGNIALGLIKTIERLENKILHDFQGKVSDASPSELSDTIRFINHL